MSYNDDIENAEVVVRMIDFMQNKPPVNSQAMKCLTDLQQRLKRWQEENFDEDCTGPEWMALGATEELGEVAHIIVKAKQRIRQHQAGLNDKSLNDLADGVADTVIYLMQLCSHLGIDFGKTLFYTAETVMQRNWRVNKTDGVSK
jgi:NTP pyrophosphatase (non-canonical NTP hydrolase)